MKLNDSMLINKISILFFLLTGITMTSNAVAGFEVMQPDPEVHYGNAQNQSFKRAMESQQPLDADDRTFLASVEEKLVTNRWYYKALIGLPKSKLKNVVNDTEGVLGEPATRNAQDDTFHVVIAGGYKWTRWAAELELLISESLKYSTIPMISGQPIGLQSTIKPWAVFLNLEYEIPTFFDFIPKRLHPYATLGPGLSIKSVDSESLSLGGQPRQQKSNRTTDFAWNFSLGAKFQVTTSILIDVAYRWIQLGEVKFGPIEGLKVKANDLDTRGFYLGITYQP